MKTTGFCFGLQLLLGWIVLAGSGGCSETPNLTIVPSTPPPPEPGVALAVIYDTSGSMAESVPDAQGQNTPKHVVAERALLSIVDQLAAYQASAAPDAPRRVNAELIVLKNRETATVLPMKPFRPDDFRKALRALDAPQGATPLGLALREAARDLLACPLSRKHILLITDGENTEGPDPALVLPSLKAQARSLHQELAVYFVAFDVKASVFDPVRRVGAEVFSAADEKELTARLGTVLQERILLENEEPAPGPATTTIKP